MKKKSIHNRILNRKIIGIIVSCAFLIAVICVSIVIVQTRCQIIGCNNTAKKYGYCDKHILGYILGMYDRNIYDYPSIVNSSARSTYSVSTKKTCLNSDCNNTAGDSGYCEKHTKKHSYTGTCAASGCDKDAYCGSYCAAHDICKNKNSCKTANYGGRKICLNSNCGNTAVDEGYCSKHGPNYDPYKCVASGCNKKASKGSYCEAHYPKKE